MPDGRGGHVREDDSTGGTSFSALQNVALAQKRQPFEFCIRVRIQE